MPNKYTLFYVCSHFLSTFFVKATIYRGCKYAKSLVKYCSGYNSENKKIFRHVCCNTLLNYLVVSRGPKPLSSNRMLINLLHRLNAKPIIAITRKSRVVALALGLPLCLLVLLLTLTVNSGRAEARTLSEPLSEPLSAPLGESLSNKLGNKQLQKIKFLAARSKSNNSKSKRKAKKKHRSKLAPPPSKAPEFDKPKFSEKQPSLLSKKDRELYKKLFLLHKNAKWNEADKLIAKLKDKTLLGHVMFERYMHPRSYRSSAKELKKWLARYNDHPNAKKLYKLAYKRSSKSQRRSLKAPSAPVLPFAQAKEEEEKTAKKSQYNRTERRVIYRLRRYVHKTRVTYALQYLNSKKKVMRKAAYAKGMSVVVAGYIFNGLDEKALFYAEEQANLQGAKVPELHWWAGLAAFRLKKFERAAWHFEQVATSSIEPNSNLSAQATYWGARAYLRLGKPDQSSRLLKISQTQPHSFYGQLATETLGYESQFDWQRVPQKKENLAKLVSFPAGRRAIGLIEVEQYLLAAQEFVRFQKQLSEKMLSDYMIYAHRRGQADLAYRIGLISLHQEGKRFDFALYPLPKWHPREGFNIEPALLYAFMRQESAFKPYARSRVGATGLMQLMPRTAQYMANRKLSLQFLKSPEDNLALGQKYLQFLMNDRNIGKNLVFISASYNGGPGNVLRWVSKGENYQQDPLLFVETIPLRETRFFVKKVLANYWIYQNRLGERTTSRRALAMGHWPLYDNHVPYPQDLTHKYGKLR